MNYQVKAPNGKEITIGLRHGSMTLLQDTIVQENEITKLFPEYFKVVKEHKEPKTEPKIITKPVESKTTNKKVVIPKGSFKKR